MEDTLPDRVRLGGFEVDLRAGELRQERGAVLVLAEQPLQILRLLVEADGRIVTRDQIQRRLWPDDTVVVDFEHSINTAVKKLRRALVDSGEEPLYIQTIAKRGYRLLVMVERVEAPEEARAGGSSGTTGPFVRAEVARDETTDLSSSPSPRAPGPRRSSRWKWLAAGAVVVCAAAVAAVFYGRMHQAPKLTEQDTIVLADFDNKTGDPVFDDTLQQALMAQLEQSPFLNIVSNRKVRQTLKLMNRSAADPLKEDTAREVCLRTGSKALLANSITQLGSKYVIGLRALDCNIGETLAEVQERAIDKDGVLKALDKAATKIRNKLGESLSSVQRYDTPLSQSTTPSLDALRAYSMGYRTLATKGSTAALPLFERAVELDAGFARAYALLSLMYWNLGEIERAEKYGRKAFELRDKVSEVERYHIEANYYQYVTGELEKAALTYELWKQTYPREFATYANLGIVYGRLGDQEKFIEEIREAARMEPNYADIYVLLAAAYQNLNRLEEAEAVYRQADERKLASEGLIDNRYSKAFLAGDTAQMAQMAHAAIGKPGIEDALLALQADTEAWYGKLRNARELTTRAMDSAQHNDAKETAAAYQAEAALREAESGNRKQARTDAYAALKLASNRNVRELSALTLARTGDTSEAEKLASELNVAYPLDTQVQRYWLPAIRAAAALENNDPNRAIELLKIGGTIEFGLANQVNVFLCPAYVRGEAYLALHNGRGAAAEFQKFVDHYGLVANFPLGALARLGLARAYALEAQTDPAARDKARTAYQNFLTIWRDADPDIPIYRQAKAEYAKLKLPDSRLSGLR